MELIEPTIRKKNITWVLLDTRTGKVTISKKLKNDLMAEDEIENNSLFYMNNNLRFTLNLHFRFVIDISFSRVDFHFFPFHRNSGTLPPLQ